MIKNVVFDLGVVLLDVDYQKTIEAFSTIGLPNAHEAFSKEKQSEFFRKYERGLISDEEFLRGLSERTGGADLLELRRAWCAMLGKLPNEKFKFVQELSAGYSLFILSNTNRIHQLWFEKQIDDQYGWQNFSNHFEYIGYSHEIHQRKPDGKVFQLLLNSCEIEPQETLFVDDTLEHIKGARKLGIHALHYAEGEDLKGLVTAFLTNRLTVS